MISVHDLKKTYKLYATPANRLKEIVFRRKCHREHPALRGISFDVRNGETLGIIGPNGAGKSTLLKLLCGILLPDSGIIRIDGRVAGILELGTGFNFEFTGRKNIYFNGLLLGMARSEIDEKLVSIIEFTELGKFIDEPVKTYSGGMLMRLAFAVAIHADPHVFMVDEVLAVGDAYFQQKCMSRIKEFKSSGGSIVFVSHDMNAVSVICDKALLLDQGAVLELGGTEEVINSYNYLLARKGNFEKLKVADSFNRVKAYGNQKVQILGVSLLNAEHNEAEVFHSGEPFAIDVSIKASESVDNITVGILIKDRFGQDIFGINTYHLNETIRLLRGERIKIGFMIDELNLGSGKYTVTVAAHSKDVHLDKCYQWADGIKAFEVVSGVGPHFSGMVRLKSLVKTEPI